MDTYLEQFSQTSEYRNGLTPDVLNQLFEINKGQLVRKVNKGPAKRGSVAGSLHPDGYRLLKISGHNYAVHRIIFLMSKGFVPKYLDHIDRDRSNNNIENLRPSTSRQNALNRPTNRFRGVSRRPNGNWEARLRVNKTLVYLGVYVDEGTAAMVVNDYVMANSSSDDLRFFHLNEA